MLYWIIWNKEDKVLVKNWIKDTVINGIEAKLLSEVFEDETASHRKRARAGVRTIMNDNNGEVILNGAGYPYVDVLEVYDREEYEREVEGTIDEELDNLYEFVQSLPSVPVPVDYELFGEEVQIVKVAEFYHEDGITGLYG